jgi:GT2 family glycosyltransferase
MKSKDYSLDPNMKKNPSLLCSVIILNFNGQRVIEKVVKSVLSSRFPKKNFEILIPDNNSKDKSRTILKKLSKKYSQVKPLFLDKNYGFAGGNNRAIVHAKGKYIILLNNDCIVDRYWLRNLYETAETDPTIFSVNSKILLFPKYIHFHFDIFEKIPLLEISLTKSFLHQYTSTSQPYILPFTPTPPGYQLDIPFEPNLDKSVELTLKFYNNGQTIIPVDIVSKSENMIKVLQIIKTHDNIYVKIFINISKISSVTFKKIQNAGNYVFQDGHGRDIGAQVKYMSQDYEIDQNQYNQTREIYSSCGAACLYRKKILDKIGLLDENFFMYYEDIEICERARLAGYKIMYSPAAVAHHLHALSSREWSKFFIYNVEKGRLLHVFYHFPLSVFLSEFSKYKLIAIYKLIKSLKHPKQIKTNLLPFKVLFYFFLHFPLILSKKISFKNIYNTSSINTNYKTILSGYWYHN